MLHYPSAYGKVPHVVAEKGFTRLEREYAEPKEGKRKSKGTKRVAKNPKGAKREQKDAKRERQGDQNTSKNRSSEKVAKMEPKVSDQLQFVGSLLGAFSIKNTIENSSKNR